VEPKTLGFGILSEKIFKNVFKHLGVVATPLRCLQMVLYTWSWLREVKELVDFRKNGIVYKCSPNQLPPCNHIAPVWDRA
jgi:hypothetical protein